MRKLTLIVIGVVLAAWSLMACSPQEPAEIKRDLFALDTYITFTVFGGEEAQQGLDAAIARIHEIENRMSVTIEGSDVDLINQAAGVRPVKVHEDTFFVVERGLSYGEFTDGAFDITIYPLIQLWDIGGDNPRVPDKDEILETLRLIDYQRVIINPEERSVFLETEGMKMDLGGIAKGYVGDEAIRILKEHGVQHGLINLGGDILVMGGKPDGSDWRIGIQNPRAEDGGPQHFSIVNIREGSIVTSGDYERYMVDVYEETGIRYHHIFDPRTGYPAETGLISATIIGEYAVDTDALSTTQFILGLQEGRALIETVENTHAIAVTTDKDVFWTPGMGDNIRINHPDYQQGDAAP